MLGIVAGSHFSVFYGKQFTLTVACTAGVFSPSKRHFRFLKQRKVGERNKFLPWAWLIGERKEGEWEGKELSPYLTYHPLPTFTESKHGEWLTSVP